MLSSDIQCTLFQKNGEWLSLVFDVLPQEIDRNDWYKEGLQKETDTKIFHARFDPDNQYTVRALNGDRMEDRRAFKRHGSEEEGFTNRYYVGHDTYIPEEYIVSVEKFTPKQEY